MDDRTTDDKGTPLPKPGGAGTAPLTPPAPDDGRGRPDDPAGLVRRCPVCGTPFATDAELRLHVDAGHDPILPSAG